jgi:hypothetical protein
VAINKLTNKALVYLEEERIERWRGFYWGVQRENGLRDRQNCIGVFRGIMD